jgi:hypothetical protein
MTFFFDIPSAPFDRQTETIMGSILGVNPTATAIEKKNVSAQLCLVNPLIRRTRGTMTRMSWIISSVNRCMPSKLVATSGPMILLAIRPKPFLQVAI